MNLEEIALMYLTYDGIPDDCFVHNQDGWTVSLSDNGQTVELWERVWKNGVGVQVLRETMTMTKFLIMWDNLKESPDLQNRKDFLSWNMLWSMAKLDMANGDIVEVKACD